MAKKYTIPFNSNYGKECQIDIYVEGATGDVIELIGGSNPFIVEQDRTNSSTALKGIIDTYYKIEFISTESVTLANFDHEQYGDVWFKYYEEGDLCHVGVISPFESGSPYEGDGYYAITLSGESGIKNLKNREFRTAEGAFVSGKITLQSAINLCLTQLFQPNQFHFESRVGIEVFVDGTQVSTGEDFMSQYIDAEAFKTGINTWMSCYEVLETILAGTFDLTFDNKKWVIDYSRDYLASDRRITQYSASSFLSSNVVAVAPIALDNGAILRNGSEGRQFSKKNIKINKEIKSVRNSLTNGVFAASGSDILGWTNEDSFSSKTIGGYGTQDEPYYVKIDGSVYGTPAPPSSDTEWMESTPFNWNPFGTTPYEDRDFATFYDNDERLKISLDADIGIGGTKGSGIGGHRLEIKVKYRALIPNVSMASQTVPSLPLYYDATLWYTNEGWSNTEAFYITGSNKVEQIEVTPPYVPQLQTYTYKAFEFGRYSENVPVEFEVKIRIYRGARKKIGEATSEVLGYGYSIKYYAIGVATWLAKDDEFISGASYEYLTTIKPDRQSGDEITSSIYNDVYPFAYGSLFSTSSSTTPINGYQRRGTTLIQEWIEFLATDYLRQNDSRLYRLDLVMIGNHSSTQIFTYAGKRFRVYDYEYNVKSNQHKYTLIEVKDSGSDIILKSDEGAFETVVTSKPTNIITDYNDTENTYKEGDRFRLKDRLKNITKITGTNGKLNIGNSLVVEEFFYLVAAEGGTIKDVSEVTGEDWTLIKPAENGTYATREWVNKFYWGTEGNTVTSEKKIGTIDNFDLPIIRNNVEKIRVKANSVLINDIYFTNAGSSQNILIAASDQSGATGTGNLAIGGSISTGQYNVVLGINALSGGHSYSENVAIGYLAGSNYIGNIYPGGQHSSSVYIGHRTRSLQLTTTNEIVIGNRADGNGDNTATIGNSSIVANYFNGSLKYGTLLKPNNVAGTNGQVLGTNGTQDAWTSLKTVGGSSILGTGDIAFPAEYSHPTQTAISLASTGVEVFSTIEVNTLGHATTFTKRTLPTASGTQIGVLSSTDWTTFNNKQNALTLGNITGSDFAITGGTGAVIGSGVGISLATITQGSGSIFGKFSLDTKGRVIGNTAVVKADLTSLLGTIQYLPYNTGTTNYLTKWSNTTGGLVNSQIFDNGTSVGIGTSSPQSIFHIKQTNGSLINEVNHAINTNSYLFTYSDAGGGNTYGGKFGYYLDSVGDPRLSFFTLHGGVETQVVSIPTSNNYVGIGTINPTNKLHIVGEIRQTSVLSNLLKTDSNGVLVAAVANTDYVNPSYTGFDSRYYTETEVNTLFSTFSPTLTTNRIGIGVAGVLGSSTGLTWESNRYINITEGGNGTAWGISGSNAFIQAVNGDLRLEAGVSTSYSNTIQSISVHNFNKGIKLNNSFGTTGQVLTSQGGGVNAWTTITSGSPTLTDTYIGFGSGGVLSGSSSLTWSANQIHITGGTGLFNLGKGGGDSQYYVDAASTVLNLYGTSVNINNKISLWNVGTGVKDFGTAGQVLTSGGAGGNNYWSTPSAGGGSQNLDSVLGVGNIGINKQLVLNNTSGGEKDSALVFKRNGTEKGIIYWDSQYIDRLIIQAADKIQIVPNSGGVELYGSRVLMRNKVELHDGLGNISAGTAGQVLTSGGSGATYWSTPSGGGGGSQSLQDVINVNNTVTSNSIIMSNSTDIRLYDSFGGFSGQIVGYNTGLFLRSTTGTVYIEGKTGIGGGISGSTTPDVVIGSISGTGNIVLNGVPFNFWHGNTSLPFTPTSGAKCLFSWDSTKNRWEMQKMNTYVNPSDGRTYIVL